MRAVEHPGSRRWPLRMAALAAAAVLLFLLLTSASPWAPERRDATAQQVEAAQNAFEQIKRSRLVGRPTLLRLGPADLDGIGAMVSQGFPPNRIDVGVRDAALVAVVSRPLLGRWLNLKIRTVGEGTGFPPVRVTVGAISLPSWASRVGLLLGRRLIRLRGATLPPLDRLVQESRVRGGIVEAMIWFPKSGIVDHGVARNASAGIDDGLVAQLYCRLADQQRAAPDPLFAHQVRRVFAATQEDPAQHGAAFVALAMFAVDPGFGHVTGDAQQRVRACAIPSPALTLQGRTDSPKHWSLSAAMAAASGARLAVTMGEWKELSDSVAAQRYLDRNERSGFSFVDLAADRAGDLTAKAAGDPQRSAATRARLLNATDRTLLPVSMTRLNDGMPNDEFVRQYGGTDDARFRAAVRSIDEGLRRGGIE